MQRKHRSHTLAYRTGRRSGFTYLHWVDPSAAGITKRIRRNLADAHRPWCKRERKEVRLLDPDSFLSIQWISRACGTVARTWRRHTIVECRRSNCIPTIVTTGTSKGLRFAPGAWNTGRMAK